MKIEYFQTIRKRNFEENPKNFLTAGHLVFLRPFPAAGHIATATKIFTLWPKESSYKEFDKEKKFLLLENSPPPHNFSNGPSLS